MGKIITVSEKFLEKFSEEFQKQGLITIGYLSFHSLFSISIVASVKLLINDIRTPSLLVKGLPS